MGTREKIQVWIQSIFNLGKNPMKVEIKRPREEKFKS